jgi:hypothetical protein
MGFFKKYGPILMLLLGTILLILLSIPELITSPNDFLLISEGDGLKSYYVFDYQLKNRDSFNHFSGLNYPFGENYLFTDGFPALQYGCAVTFCPSAPVLSAFWSFEHVLFLLYTDGLVFSHSIYAR